MKRCIDLLVLICVSTACSNVDRHQPALDDSVELSRAATASSSDPGGFRSGAARDSSAGEKGVTSAEIATWRSSSIPDRVDSLMAAAFNTEGAFTSDSEMYEFSGSEKAINDLGNSPNAVPRLLDCLGWDQRAAATYQGARLLVGVICDQALMRNPKIKKLLTTPGPGGYPKIGLDVRNPSIGEVRAGQLAWRSLLQNTAM